MFTDVRLFCLPTATVLPVLHVCLCVCHQDSYGCVCLLRNINDLWASQDESVICHINKVVMTENTSENVSSKQSPENTIHS